MRIGFTGPIADKNLGDYGMLVNNIYDIGRDNEYFIFSYDIDFSKWIKNEYLSNFKITIIPINLKLRKSTPKKSKKRINTSVNKRIQNRVKTYICNFLNIQKRNNNYKKKNVDIITPLEIIRNLVNYKELFDLISSLDLLVINGGGYFNELWYTWSRKDDFFSILSPLIIANYLEKKIVFTSNSFGPFYDSLPFFKQLLSELKNVHFGIRDNLLSKANLLCFGIPREKISWIPDDLFYLNKKLKKRERIIHFDKYVVLEISQPIQDILEEIKELVRFFYKHYNMKTVYLYFTKGGAAEENSFKLEKQLKDDKIFTYHPKEVAIKIEEVYSIIRDSDFVISNRYHAFLIALANRIPTMNVLKKISGDRRYYYNKCFGLLDQIFQGISVNIFDYLLEDFPQALKKIKKEFDKILTSQKRRYSSPKYLNNLKTFYNCRSNYIKEKITLNQ